MPNQVKYKDPDNQDVMLDTHGTALTGQTLVSGYGPMGWYSSIFKALTDFFTTLLGRWPLAITYADRSGAIAAGGTAQQMMAANASRKSLFIQNPDTSTLDIWLRFTGTAVVGSTASIKLAPGDVWEERGAGITTQAVSVISSTTGAVWSALEG